MKSEMVLVCDVDDTICFTDSRDYKNSKPNTPLIAKLHEARSLGFTIVLHTARGQGRSNDDVASVATEVEAEILEMCSRLDVPFDKIILGKVWAKYYIDDKALRPDEFINTVL